MAYFLTMEGRLFEADLVSLDATELFDLNKELKLPQGAQPHYKGMFSAQGRVVVANNTYEEPEYLGERHAGRLAEWDGEGEWTVLEENPFIEVSGKQNPRVGSRYGNTLYAVTDRRAIIWIPMRYLDALEIHSFDRGRVAKIHRMEYPDGSGDVYFTITGEAVLHNPEEPQERLGFKHIPEARRVEELLRRTLLDPPAGPA